MLNKVAESMLGTYIEQKFEELQVEELRAQRQAEIDEQMKDKGKGVDGSSAVLERSIVPSMLRGDDDEDDDDEEDDEDGKVFSRSSHGSDNDDDDAQGGT
ncbi:hypothetical protein Hanom_Chr08g00721071 [Helianthus anomalus]